MGYKSPCSLLLLFQAVMYCMHDRFGVFQLLSYIICMIGSVIIIYYMHDRFSVISVIIMYYMHDRFSYYHIQVNSRYNDSGYNIIPVCTYKLLWSRTKHDL